MESKIRAPAHLRGREIGLFYRNLNRNKIKQEKCEKPKPRICLGPSIIAPNDILARVQQHLRNFEIKSDDGQQISTAFENHFHHLLSVNFEDFILQCRSNKLEYLEHNEALNKRMKTEMLYKESTTEFRKIFEQRQKLPTMLQQSHILEGIRNHQIVLVVGSTGCGKTTQVPQMVLDEFIYENRGSQARIVCTQPRRISTIAVAERVAYERCEPLGNSVGYSIRLESKMPRDIGSILFCTTGILLQKMQSDPLMTNISTLIIDEIHERSVETDLLMALLKKILPFRKDLKVILMSATVCEEDFRRYFDNCHTLNVEGTLFPVQMLYLEDILQETGYAKFQDATLDKRRKPGKKSTPGGKKGEQKMEYDAMMEPYLRQIKDKYDPFVINSLRCMASEGCENLAFLEYFIFYICEHKPPGAILVFLPGFDQISKLHAALQRPTVPNAQRQRIVVYPLHSMMPTVDQKNIFQSPPLGVRKIILSTILAETSVTIDDVVYVINSGRTKTKSYNPETNIESLDAVWVTKANSKQRRGRAGRVQPGICYNLFSKARERTMNAVPTPEIVRCKLEGIILTLKLLHITDPFEFMNTLINVPNTLTIQTGIKMLKRIEALDEYNALTPLGMHLAHLPLDPQIGKMVLMSAIFRCVDPITSVAAGLSYKSPFYTPLGQEQKVDETKRELANGTKSDHLLIDSVILSYRDACFDKTERNFCYKNFLSVFTMIQLENMKQQFAGLLKDASFVESSDCKAKASNQNSNNIPLLRAIIAAGLYPNMAMIRKSRKTKNRVQTIHQITTPEGRIVFHPSSVNSKESSFDSNFFVYFQKQKSSSLYMLDATMVFPMALIIFGDHIATGVHEGQFYISVADNYYFKCNEITANVIIKLRQCLSLLLKKKALYPSPILPDSVEDSLIKGIQLLLSLDEVEDFDDEFPSSEEYPD